MESLPEEMLRAIFQYLPVSSLLPAAFTCSRWFNILRRSLPIVRNISISLDALSCIACFQQPTESQISFATCVCSKHSERRAILFELIFQTAGKEITTLVIEDSSVPKENMETQIPDATVHVLFSNIPTCVKSLHFQGVDFSKVRPWTFALLVKLNELEELYILDTELPIDNESLLIRIFSPSFTTLTNLSITNNELITDKFALTLAQRCPLLQTINLNGCKRITSLSVFGFVENAPHRLTELTFIHVQATMFDFNMLQKFLLSPLLAGGNFWKANALKLEIGFEHDAVYLENIRLNNLLILVFI
ncbi:unnamed protein product [Thelazia callipaeda]|uniref:F-box domain-containing protein n=1 Tax=Thelazia callipaeda TaxID=103827 RepID=A0A0N5CJL6_THECL|nr:unnamed protein product [Thelazia callipaeda]